MLRVFVGAEKENTSWPKMLYGMPGATLIGTAEPKKEKEGKFGTSKSMLFAESTAFPIVDLFQP